MRRTAPLAWLLVGVAALLVGVTPCRLGASSDALLAVIVSPTSTLSDVSMADLKRVFQSEPRTAPDGTRLIPLNHPPRTVDRAGFDRAVLGMDPEAVGRFWIDRKTQRGSGPPRTVESLATLRRVIEKLPGAIGYVRPSRLSNEVRVIRVDGKLPEDPGYPVHYSP